MTYGKNISNYKFTFFQQLFSNTKSGKGFFFYEFDEDQTMPKEPYRIEPYAIYLLHEGELSLEISLHQYNITAPAIFVLAPNVIRHCINKSSGYKCQGIFFNKDYFLQLQADVNYLDRYDFFYLKDKQVLLLTPERYEKLNAYFQLIKQNAGESFANTPNILRGLIYVVLEEVAAANELNAAAGAPLSHHEKVLLDFKNLLSEGYKTHRSVSYYAEQLHLSPKHFSTIIKQESGKTAGEWIDEMVLLEARVLLCDPQSTIAQVADALNFNDPSTFGKFFKNLTGVSPLDYRKRDA